MYKTRNNFQDMYKREAISDGDASSDITQKTVSDIRPAQQRKINIRKLRRPETNGNCLTAICNFLTSCFNCFQPQEDTSTSYGQRSANGKSS